MTKIGSCKASESSKHVLILKQWHLAPKTITKSFKEKYPQEKNQTAIYQMLEEAVKRGDLQLVVSEGCEGEINSEFKTAFNGWDYTSLKAQAYQRDYRKIITLVPLKIEAKFDDKILTLCGDNNELIQAGNMHLSNLRGWWGFYARLKENKEDQSQTNSYSAAAADLLKIPRDTPPAKLMLQIKDKIKSELELFHKSLRDRNDAFVKVLQAQDFKKAAVVIGGLHGADLRHKIEAAGLGCEELEPPGYQSDSERLIRDFERALE